MGGLCLSDYKLDSDHKPLEMIFVKPLVSAPICLQKMLMRLQLHNLSIRYKKGTELLLADTLSRRYLEETRERDGNDLEVKGIQSVFGKGIGRRHSYGRPELSARHREPVLYLSRYNRSGRHFVAAQKSPTSWLTRRQKIPTRTTISILSHPGRARQACRSQILRRSVTDQLHARQQGVASTLLRERELLFWPNMAGELKDDVSMCDVCCALGPKQPKKTLVCHDVPRRPWAKITTEFEDKSYLVTVD